MGNPATILFIASLTFAFLQGCTADFDKDSSWDTEEGDPYWESASDNEDDSDPFMDTHPKDDTETVDERTDTECSEQNDQAKSNFYPDCDGDGFFSYTPVRACDEPGADAFFNCQDGGSPKGGWSETPGDDCDDEDALLHAPECGMTTDVFTPDGKTLAIFELNGDVQDSSGNGRHATFIGGAFVDTTFGQGLKMNGDPQGFSWNFATLIKSPFTIEMVLIPENMSNYEKLFSPNDKGDEGWYYYERGFEAWPNGKKGSGFKTNTRHYLAIVSETKGSISIYSNSVLIGKTSTSFSEPPAKAIFFRDDQVTGRSEFFKGVAEAVRISNAARSASEIAAIQNLLEAG